MRKKLLSLIVLMVFLLSFVTACSKPNQNTVNGKQEQTNQTVSKEQKDDQDDGDTNDDKYDNKDNDKNNNKDSKDDDKKDNKKDQDNDQDDDKNNQNSKDDSKNTKDSKDDKNDNDDKSDDSLIDEDGHYTSKDEVALYIHTYGKLPNNYITKGEAKKLGWDSKKGNLFEVTDGKSIGGDKFSNREGKLPKEDGRKWYECDIDYDGGHRGAKRIVYSNDGLIYYTDDHYETFTLLYEGE